MINGRTYCIGYWNDSEWLVLKASEMIKKLVIVPTLIVVGVGVKESHKNWHLTSIS